MTEVRSALLSVQRRKHVLTWSAAAVFELLSRAITKLCGEVRCIAPETEESRVHS
jgi:hypothetical protein